MSHQTMWRATMANEREKMRHEQEMQKMWEKVRTTRCHSKREFDKLRTEYVKMLAYAYVYKLHGFTRNDPAKEEREKLKQENLEMFERCYEKHSRTRSNSPEMKRTKTPRTRSESPRAEKRTHKQSSSDEKIRSVSGIKDFDKLFPAIANKKPDKKPKILGLKGKGIPPPVVRPHSEISLSASKREAVEINQNFKKVLIERQNTNVELLGNGADTPEPGKETFCTEIPENTNNSVFPEIPRHWSMVHRTDTLAVDPYTGAIILGPKSDKKKKYVIGPKVDKDEIVNSSTDEKEYESYEKETTSTSESQHISLDSRKLDNTMDETDILTRTMETEKTKKQKEKGSEKPKPAMLNDSKVPEEINNLKSEDLSSQVKLGSSLTELHTQKRSSKQGIRVELFQKSKTLDIPTSSERSRRENTSELHNKNTISEEEPLPVSNTVSLMLASIKQKELPNRKAHSEPTWRLRYMMKLRQQHQKANRSLSPIPERPKSIIPQGYCSKLRRRQFLEQEVDRVMREWDPATHRAKEAQKLLQLSKERTQIDITRLKNAMLRDFRVCIEEKRPKFPPINNGKYLNKDH